MTKKPKTFSADNVLAGREVFQRAHISPHEYGAVTQPVFLIERLMNLFF